METTRERTAGSESLVKVLAPKGTCSFSVGIPGEEGERIVADQVGADGCCMVAPDVAAELVKLPGWSTAPSPAMADEDLAELKAHHKERSGHRGKLYRQLEKQTEQLATVEKQIEEASAAAVVGKAPASSVTKLRTDAALLRDQIADTRTVLQEVEAQATDAGQQIQAEQHRREQLRQEEASRELREQVERCFTEVVEAVFAPALALERYAALARQMREDFPLAPPVQPLTRKQLQEGIAAAAGGQDEALGELLGMLAVPVQNPHFRRGVFHHDWPRRFHLTER